MTHFENLLNQIDSLYGAKRSYNDLVLGHLFYIKLFSEMWIDVGYQKPQEGQRVLGLEDLTPLGKGQFVSDYYYEGGQFVANPRDCDGYGYITYWIPQETLEDYYGRQCT